MVFNYIDWAEFCRLMCLTLLFNGRRQILPLQKTDSERDKIEKYKLHAQFAEVRDRQPVAPTGITSRTQTNSGTVECLCLRSTADKLPISEVQLGKRITEWRSLHLGKPEGGSQQCIELPSSPFSATTSLDAGLRSSLCPAHTSDQTVQLPGC